jgi:hypothetical protein
MFLHAAYRPLWPAMVFLPWLFLGLAYLVRALRRQPLPAARRAPAARQE